MDRDLIYDVGMHKGEDTEYYLKRGFRVVAFEANPELVAVNEKNFATAVAQGRLKIVSGAIVEHPVRQHVEFFRNVDQTAWGTVNGAWADRNATLGARSEVILVPAVDFGACLKEFGTPYYMKIDIEGADTVCLETLRAATQVPPYLSIESDKLSFERLVREIDTLSELGYTEFAAVQQAQMFRRRIPGGSSEGPMVRHRFRRGSSGLFGQDITGWVSKSEILKIYRRIFASYERFGDRTFWHKNRVARCLLTAYSVVLSHPLPGWYDTHARLR